MQLLCHILRMVSHLLQHVIQFVLFMVVKSYRELQIVKRAEVEFTMAVHCDLVRIWIKAVIAIHLLGLMNNLYDFEEQEEVVEVEVEDHLEEVVVHLEVVLEDLGEEIQVLHCREDLVVMQDLLITLLVVEVAVVDTMVVVAEQVEMIVEGVQEHLQAVEAEVLM